jgi:hypothetical protein
VSTEISLKDQYIWVSNRRFSTLLEFVHQVGADRAGTEEERRSVERLRRFVDEEAWPGISFGMDKHFDAVAEKKFWAIVFQDIDQRISLRQIGHHDVTIWQSTAIGDAYVIERLLTRAVQEVEPARRPDTENAREEGDYLPGRINVRL